MKFNTYDIELLLRVYPKVKKEKGFSKTREQNFSDFIIINVELWLELLCYDEKEIIVLRYFKRKTVDYITGYLGYSNHSSVIKKLSIILKKIQTLFYN